MTRFEDGHEDTRSKIPRRRLAGRLRARSDEIVDAIFTELTMLPGDSDVSKADLDYLAGLRLAIVDGVDYALRGIEHHERWRSPPPLATVTQARRAAREGVALETLLRLYAAGDRVLREYVSEEANGIPQVELRGLLKAQGGSADRFMRTVANEYMGEFERLRQSPTSRREARVQQLLAGDSPTDVSDLGYDLGGWHVGVIGRGPEAAVHFREAAAQLDRRALICRSREGMIAGWYGGRREIRLQQVERVLEKDPMAETSWAVGEPRVGVDGWRLTFREAEWVLPVLIDPTRHVARAQETILLAAALSDTNVAKSLRETYLMPLDALGMSAKPMRATLLAYVRSGLNAASAAALLEIDRSTVQRHLRKAEEILGRMVHSCYAELRVALELAELAERGL